MDNAVHIYKSKKGFVIYIPLIILLVIEIVYIATGQYIPGLLCLAITGVIFFPIFFNTYYAIANSNGILKVKSGLIINTSIEIETIKKIKKTRTLMSSPALSLDRIEIFYNKFDSVIVSPENKAEFVAELKSINPAIEYFDQPE
jgi:hypothetical protein